MQKCEINAVLFVDRDARVAHRTALRAVWVEVGCKLVCLRPRKTELRDLENEVSVSKDC